MAFPDGWGYKWPIAINADSVISSPVADWPCLITDAHFPAGAWAQMQPTGADLRFSLDEAGATELYYDAPRLSVAGESAHLYVAVPSLASTADTTIWAWVGNAEATAPSAAWMQGTYPATWAAHYPIEEGTGTTVYDRTSNAKHGTLTNMDSATDWVQQADGSWVLDFDGSDDSVVFPAACQNVAAFSVLMRSYHNTLGNAWVGRWAGGSGKQFMMRNNVQFYLRNAANTAEPHATKAITAAQWVSLVGVADGSNLRVVADTVAGSSVTAAGPYIPVYADLSWKLGSGYNGFSSLQVDSLTYLSRAVTTDEVAIHHLMLSAPATWASAGELVAVGGSHYPAAKYLVLLKRPVAPPVGSGQTGDTCYGEVRNLEVVT